MLKILKHYNLSFTSISSLFTQGKKHFLYFFALEKNTESKLILEASSTRFSASDFSHESTPYEPLNHTIRFRFTEIFEFERWCPGSDTPHKLSYVEGQAR